MSTLTNRQRFLRLMDYKPVDRAPNWEAGVWGQTCDRWAAEGLPPDTATWDWFVGEECFGLDVREFVPLDWGMKPPFEYKVLERTERYETVQDGNGSVRKALLEGTAHGTRASMDQFLRFAVETPADFAALKERYPVDRPRRYPPYWRELLLPGWKKRRHVLVLGRNCAPGGFYWRAREWMGTENLCFAWYDQPKLMHEMLEFYTDFTLQVAAPLLAELAPDYFIYAEDLAMKTGPLLGPATYKEFIFPRLRRMVDFFHAKGIPHVGIDTDGNCEPLIPLMLDAGIDFLWPLERAAGMDPLALRKKFGRALRLWGGVDKRELACGPEAIEAHLRELAPLIEQGGFIPTVDHCVPPDVSLESFRYYMKRKEDLLAGRY
ncbi:MAG: uroporphyrinogen decarboxylase family protein [Planctomycetota bacterium]